MLDEYFRIEELGKKEHRITEFANIRHELFDNYVDIVGGYRGNYIVKYPNEETWLTETHYPCPVTYIAKHLSNNDGYAVGLRSSWCAKHFDIDVDQSEWQNEIVGDIVEYFSEHTDIFECTREMGGMSVVGRCKAIGVDILYECLQRIIEGQLGWTVKDGIVEIYPRCDKGRRLPFGSDQKVHGILSKNEQLRRFVTASQVDLKQLSKGIKYDKTISDNSLGTDKNLDFVSGTINKFVGQAKQLLEVGLTELSTRYEAETFLIRYYYHTGYSEDEAFCEIESWLHSKNNDYSEEYNDNSQKLLQRVNKHVWSYYKWLRERQMGLSIDTSTKLSDGDIRRINELSKSDFRFAEWFYDLLLYVKQRTAYSDNLFLSATTLRSFKQGRNYVEYRKRIIDKGFMKLKGKYSVGSHSNVYKVNYKFDN